MKTEFRNTILILLFAVVVLIVSFFFLLFGPVEKVQIGSGSNPITKIANIKEMF